jgi:UDP-N-acetylglucosamine--N-acetylmuramyl-(pentapeptide) pyrophosphoryl-undecaprenol N-acetylglucosamine transferase
MNVILAGSATGGHIYPATAIADKIRRKNPDANIVFVGAKKELGSTIVEDNGYRIRYIDIRGFSRKNMLANIKVLKDLAVSSAQIKKIFKQFQPDMVIGTGGYVSGPVLREAHKQGIKTYLHEQNAVPGLANKIAEKYADKIFVAFEDSIKHFKNPDKIMVTGNPIRKGFITAGAMNYREQLGVGEKNFAILVFGGSIGAQKINDVTVELLTKLNNDEYIKVFFITGRRQYWDVLEALNQNGVSDDKNFKVMEYTEAMHEYFAASDLIIGRSGALTVSEITACGKPSILIPSPNVTGNHQYFNAKPLEDAGASVLIEESQLTTDLLYDTIMALKSNRERINKMAEASSSLGVLDAVDVIYNELDYN